MKIKNFKLFESEDIPDYIKDINDVMSHKSEILKEYELIISHRNISSNRRIPFIDIYKESNKHIAVGIYDTKKKQFLLFESEGVKLSMNNYLVIKSETFFDRLDWVHYKLFVNDYL